MKANEFVLEHGWDAAKRLVENNKHTGRTLSPSEIELRRLVESHTMIQSFGSLEDAKEYESMFGSGLFAQAITDVESCL